MAAHPARTTHDENDPLADKVVLAGRGDTAAFAEVYDDVAQRVFGLALRVTGDPCRAEQVAHGAFVDIWRDAARFDRTKGSALAWMMSLTHRRAVDCARSNRATRRPDDARHEVAADRLTNLTGLTGAQQRSVELAYLDGYTHTDVSRLMHEQAGVTLIRMGAALRRLCPQG